MASNPYFGLPHRALWSRGVARRYDASTVVTSDAPLLRTGDRVASMGSCFASNIVPHIEAAGVTYLRMEEPPSQVAMLPENLGYRNFSAAYGNVYTARQMRQLIERCTSTFRPEEDRWHEPDKVIDPFRPGLAYPAATDVEFDVITTAHLAATREAFATADVVVLTLGLTEGWESTLDGAVFPTCPGTVAGTFDQSRHRFRNFTVAEVVDDLSATIDGILAINARTRFIVTVSPVPLVATASGRHVLEATVYSKSVLRVAAGEVEQTRGAVTYFPAYEIVTGPQAPESFFEADRRSVTDEAIQTVMDALLAASDVSMAAAPVGAVGAAPSPTVADISRRIAEAECDEALLDQSTADEDPLGT